MYPSASKAGERTIGKHLRQVFFGALHDDVEQGNFVEFAAAGRQNPNQIGMREPGGFPQSRQVRVSSLRVRRDQLDGGVAAVPRSEENRARFAAPQELAQRKTVLDGPAFPSG
jgi:hypothetical protein